MDIGLPAAFSGGVLGVAAVLGGAAFQGSGFSPRSGYWGTPLAWCLPVRRRKRHGDPDGRLRHLVRSGSNDRRFPRTSLQCRA
jgi:hypothetical protein